MNERHDNDHHSPLKLSLTEQERESAREVIATLHDEAAELGNGLLARLWNAHAEELRRMCLPPDRPSDALDDAPIGDAFPVTCSCGQPADGIDERRTPRCAACEEGGES